LRELYRIAASHDGVFTIDDARLAGVREGEIKSRRLRVWRRLYGGVYLAPGAPATPRALIRAACLAGAPNAAASHRSGAALYDVPGGRIDITEVNLSTLVADGSTVVARTREQSHRSARRDTD